jgi:Fe2+ transport system protein FeoA
MSDFTHQGLLTGVDEQKKLLYNIVVVLKKKIMKFGFTPEAEILNGRLAMLGFVIAVGTYLTTGQILPGVF